MATIGRNAAATHLLGRDLTGFRNRLMVMINWAWDYIFYERAVRLILPRGTMTMLIIPFTLAWLTGDELLKIWGA